MSNYYILFIPFICDDVRHSVINDLSNLHPSLDYDWRYFNLNGFSYTLICFEISDCIDDETFSLMSDYYHFNGFSFFKAPNIKDIQDVFSNFSYEV